VSESKHEHGWGEYYLIFNALILLTVITVGFSYVDLGGLISSLFDVLHAKAAFIPDWQFGHWVNIVVGLVVAIIKGSLVLWFFMHQSDEEAVNRIVLGFCVGLFFLAITAFSFDFVWLKTYAIQQLAGMAVGGN
jgi:caa(3)-type oxidase subunit IV